MKKYHVETTYMEDGYSVKRVQYRDILYIYVYKKGFLSFNNVISLKVVVYE